MSNGTAQNGIKRPVMLYHGSKWRLAPWILGHFPDHREYVEPYGGAAGILIRKKPSNHEVYNDLDERVVNVFRVLRDPEKAQDLEDKIKKTPFSRAEYNLCFKETDDPVERARRVIVNTCMGYGSAVLQHKTGFRAKARKRGTTQNDVWNDYPDSIAAFCRRLKRVTLECRPAFEVINQQDTEETLFYLDPPYGMERRSDKHRYAEDFSTKDHAELADRAHEIKGMVIISGYATEYYRHLYGDWKRYDRESPTQNAGNNKTESIWLNPKAQERQTQQKLFEGSRGDG